MSETPSWLERLASGEFEPLSEVEVLCGLTEAGVKARASAESLDEAAQKRAWLKALDVPTWGKAAIALSDAASEAAEMAELTAMCDAGDDVSCRILSEQKEETATWLQKLQVSDWGAAATVLSAAALDAAAVSATAFEALESFSFRKHRSSQPPSDLRGDFDGEP